MIHYKWRRQLLSLLTYRSSSVSFMKQNNELIVVYFLKDFFRTANTQTMRTVHNHWLEMMTKSSQFSKVLGVSGLFISALLKRLSSSEAVVLCSLLKMLKQLHQLHALPRQLVLDNNLYRLVLQIAEIDSQVLVSQVANSLLFDFQESTLS